jgi:hypothetical protein
MVELESLVKAFLRESTGGNSTPSPDHRGSSLFHHDASILCHASIMGFLARNLPAQTQFSQTAALTRGAPAMEKSLHALEKRMLAALPSSTTSSSFSGDGVIGFALSNDPAVLNRVATSLEHVWKRDLLSLFMGLSSRPDDRIAKHAEAVMLGKDGETLRALGEVIDVMVGVGRRGPPLRLPTKAFLIGRPPPPQVMWGAFLSCQWSFLWSTVMATIGSLRVMCNVIGKKLTSRSIEGYVDMMTRGVRSRNAATPASLVWVTDAFQGVWSTTLPPLAIRTHEHAFREERARNPTLNIILSNASRPRGGVGGGGRAGEDVRSIAMTFVDPKIPQLLGAVQRGLKRRTTRGMPDSQNSVPGDVLSAASSRDSARSTELSLDRSMGALVQEAAESIAARVDSDASDDGVVGGGGRSSSRDRAQRLFQEDMGYDGLAVVGGGGRGGDGSVGGGDDARLRDSLDGSSLFAMISGDDDKVRNTAAWATARDLVVGGGFRSMMGGMDRERTNRAVAAILAVDLQGVFARSVVDLGGMGVHRDLAGSIIERINALMGNAPLLHDLVNPVIVDSATHRVVDTWAAIVFTCSLACATVVLGTTRFRRSTAAPETATGGDPGAVVEAAGGEAGRSHASVRVGLLARGPIKL